MEKKIIEWFFEAERRVLNLDAVFFEDRGMYYYTVPYVLWNFCFFFVSIKLWIIINWSQKPYYTIGL